MRLVTTLFTTPHGRHRRVGWFAPILEVANGLSGRSVSTTEFIGRCDDYVIPRAGDWIKAAGWPQNEAGWNRKLGQLLLSWMRHVQLLESDSIGLTETGEAWLWAWRDGDKAELGPLSLVGGARRMLTSSVLLSADGPMLLAVLDSLRLEECSLQALAHRCIESLARMSLPSSAARALPEVSTRLRGAAQDVRKASDVLACRIFPLMELGLVVRPKLGAYALTLEGVRLQEEVHAWCRNERILSAPHLRVAWRLASAASGGESWGRDALLDALPGLLERVGRATWQGRRQWPLWESLLIASAGAAGNLGRGFELEEGLAALDVLRERVPGGIEWVSGRRVDQQYFRLHLERLSPTGESAVQLARGEMTEAEESPHSSETARVELPATAA